MVVDQTRVPGHFDFTLRWGPEQASAAESGEDSEAEEPPLFTALQQQLGLKLVATKGPAEVVVIDHIERPSLDGAETAAASATVVPAQEEKVAQGTVAKREDASALPRFEVATIKPDRSGSGVLMFNNTADGIQVRGFSVQMLIRAAYGIDDDRISGAPGWLNSELYEVQAKVAGTDVPALGKLTKEQRRLMLQPLLAERFQLKTHPEKQVRPVYELVAANGGMKLKASPPPGPGDPSEPKMRMSGHGELIAERFPMALLTQWLSLHAGRPVVDRTGAAGTYDFTLQWSPEEGAASGGEGPGAYASMFTALQQQLGLKLVAARDPVDVLVIDHVERPSEN